MNNKTIFSVFIVVVIAIFAYYYTTLLQNSKEVEQILEESLIEEGVTEFELKAVTGAIVEISNEDLMLRTNGDILTIKKSANTKYVALIDNALTAIDENELKQNEQATAVVGVDSNNKMTALSVSVVR